MIIHINMNSILTTIIQLLIHSVKVEVMGKLASLNKFIFCIMITKLLNVSVYFL